MAAWRPRGSTGWRVMDLWEQRHYSNIFFCVFSASIDTGHEPRRGVQSQCERACIGHEQYPCSFQLSLRHVAAASPFLILRTCSAFCSSRSVLDIVRRLTRSTVLSVRRVARSSANKDLNFLQLELCELSTAQKDSIRLSYNEFLRMFSRIQKLEDTLRTQNRIRRHTLDLELSVLSYN
eukprot:SAG31_NODE_869_length_11344_cov_15.137839_5_plen_179_part_00